MYIYRAVRQELSTPETGPYATFGILALRLEAGQWQKVCLAADVSTSRRFGDKCAQKFPAAFSSGKGPLRVNISPLPNTCRCTRSLDGSAYS